MSHLLVGGLLGSNMLSIIVFRRWFLGLIKRYRDVAAMDGVGELAFIFQFVLRYSWQVILYMLAVHLLYFYCLVDWQVLFMGRLWNWTLGVWALDHGGADPSLRAAVALMGMLPVFFQNAVRQFV